MKARIRFLIPLSLAVVAGIGLASCGSLGHFGIGDVFSMASASSGGSDGSSSTSKAEAVGQAVKAVGKASEEITPEQEYYIGRAVAATILSSRKAFDSKKANDYLNLLGRSLSQSSDMPETFGGYHFLVLDSDEINAFGAPGGLILVSRGLLRCADSEDAVAAILAHEIAHVVRKHGLQAISTARWTSAVQSGVFAAVQVAGSKELKQLTSAFKDSISDVTSTLVNSGYSRTLELEADTMAVAILYRVGYDPRALSRMLKIMETKLKPGGADFAKTHPNPEDRIRAIDATTSQWPAAAPAPKDRLRRYQTALGSI